MVIFKDHRFLRVGGGFEGIRDELETFFRRGIVPGKANLEKKNRREGEEDKSENASHIGYLPTSNRAPKASGSSGSRRIRLEAAVTS